MEPKPNSLPSVKGQDCLRMTEENGGQGNLKFDLESEIDFESSDDESFESDSDQERRDSSKKVADDNLADRANFGVQQVPELEIDEYVEMNVRMKRKRMWEVWEEEHVKWLLSHGDADIDIDTQNEVVAETAEAPPSLIIPLLRYQKEWLAWALQQEESAARGGILADEMGMGKTIQAIALVLAKQECNRAVDGAISPCSLSSGLPQVKATLVICPLVSVIQWVNEISRFTLQGSNKVLVYHGAKRGKTIHEFSDYDFVITTYSVVQAEYRKYVLPPKEKCNWCGKSFNKQKMFIHKIHCGPDTIKTNKQSKQRKNKNAGVDVAEGKKEPLNKGKHYDKDKACGSGSLSSANDSGAEIGLCERNCNLHCVNWNRIILDEAHYIKDRRSKTTKAVLALNSSYKWALSGTPLQNGLGELCSLIRFLQISPYSYFFCKDCDCRTLYYSSDTECCPHAAVRHFCWWDKHIATPLQSRGNLRSGRNAMILLKHKLFKGILLRRTKKGRSADLALPPKLMSLRRESLDIKEEDYYTSLYNESRAQFDTYVREGTVMNNYANIFDLLTRLRQAVNHPYLVEYSKTAMSRNPSVVDANNGEVICGLCHESVEEPVVNACAHVICKSCLINFSASTGQVSCPTCKKDQGDEDMKMNFKGFRRSSILNRIRLVDFQTSTKIEALREEIRFMVERDGSAKGIVFSQFTSFLDLIHYSLQMSGVKCVQLDGSMTMKARDAAITRFTEDPDCRLFLMSMKAGGVALNLTVASHVFLMEPWWNPGVEQQAQDRIHRIGQFKPIRVVRFIIEGTIEERIVKLQEKKELVFEGTVGGSVDALGKLTENDMKFLFVL